MPIAYPPGQGLNSCAKYEFDPSMTRGLYNHKKHKYMFGYCSVTNDKIHFSVPGGSMTETWRVRLRSPGLKFQTLCL